MKRFMLKMASWVVVTTLVMGALPMAVATAAGNATIAIDPATKTVGVGESFPLDIKINAATQEVDTAQAFVNFNPAHLQVLDVTGALARPNLVIAEKSVAGTGPYTINYVIKNIGSATAPAGFDVALFITDMTTPVETQAVVYPAGDPLEGSPMPLLAAQTTGSTATGSFTYNGTLTAGDDIRLTADYNTEVTEKDETDNALTFDYDSNIGDLIVTGAGAWVSGQEGVQYRVNYSIKNIGDASLTNGTPKLDVVVYVDDMTTPLATKEISNTPITTTTTINSNFLTPLITLSGGYDVIKLVIDANGEKAEENEGNNTFIFIFPSPVIAPGSVKLNNKLSDTVDNITGKADFVFGIPTGGTPENALFTFGTLRFQAIGEATSSPVTFNTDIPRATQAIRSGANVTAVGGLTNGAVTIENLAPDLTVFEKTETWTSEAHTAYNVNYVIKNLGSVDITQDYKVSLYVDDAQTPTQEVTITDTLAGGLTQEGSFTNVSFSAPEDTVRVVVDRDNLVTDEQSETNNELTNYWPPRMADLVITSKTETWIVTDQTYRVNYTIKNQGNLEAPAGFDIALYIDGSQTSTEEIAITSALAPDAETSGNFATVTLGGGEDAIRLKVDDNAEVTESNETNNEATNIWPTPKPDLIVFSMTPRWVSEPNTYAIDYVIKNIGNADAAAGHDIALYIDGSGTAAQEIAIGSVIAPNGTVSGSFATRDISSDGTDGILVMVDDNTEVDEKNETNNTATDIFPMPKPDLVVSAMSAAWENEGAGLYTVSFTIRNDGNADAPAGHTVGLSIDGTADVQTVTVDAVIAPTGTFSGSFDVTAVGFDRIIVTADSGTDVNERNENNNSSDVLIFPTPRPDLIIAGKWETMVEGSETNYIVHFVVKNAGPGVAIANTDVELFVDGVSQGEVAIPVELAPGMSYPGTFPAEAISAETHVIKVGADANNEITNEVNETNNELSNIFPELKVGIRIEPPDQSVAIDQVFEVNIWVNANAQDIDTIQTYLNFNPEYIKVVNAAGNVIATTDNAPITSGTIVLGGTADASFSARNQQKVDNTAGTIDLALGIGTSGFAVQEEFLLATVRFQALQLIEDTTLLFERADSLRTTKAIRTLEEVGWNPDVTGNVMNGHVAVVEVDIFAPTVVSTNPVDAAVNVPVATTVEITFSEPMDQAATQTAFSLKKGSTAVTGTFAWNTSGNILTFTPGARLLFRTDYTVTIGTGALDLAGNALAVDKVLTFTTAGQAPVVLGSASAFAVLAGSTVTSTGATIVNGDLGVSAGTAVSGFPPGTLNGAQYTGAGSAAGQAQLDLTIAYNDAAGRTLAPITVAGNIGGQTLTPGLYKSTSTLAISSGDLTLDAQGDADAVWIFQIASSLTTTAGRQVILSGDAQAANIYWQVGTSATLGTNSIFKGTIMADQAITLETGATLEGRALARIAAVTLDGSTVTKPASAAGPDDTAPTVSSTVPANAATGIAVGANVQVIFSEPMDQTATEAAFAMKRGTTPVPGAITWPALNVLLFNPTADLLQWTQYNVTIGTGATDVALNALATGYAFNFTTADTLPPVDTAMNVRSTSHTVSTPSNDNTVTMVWTAATDPTPGSGLDGYSVLWDNSAATVPDNVKDIEETVVTVTSNALADNAAWYFHIRAVDVAGNWVSTQHAGPYFIDVTAPTMDTIATAADGYYRVAPVLTLGFNDNLALRNGSYKMDSAAWVQLFTTANNTTTAWDNASWTVPGFDALGQGLHTISFKATDAATNAAGDGVWTWQFNKDTVVPTVTIVQKTGQNDPTNTLPIEFTVTFSETVADFATGDVNITGTASANAVATVTGTGTSYNVAVTGLTATSGTVIAAIAAGAAHDATGNANTASTTTDATVTYDVTPLTVTIGQATAQLDPTRTLPINFTVTFNKTVTDFAGADVTLTGTGTAGATVTVTGSGASYNAAVSGLTGNGTVIATILAGAAHDAAGNANTLSTFTDNSVLYDNIAPAGPTGLASPSHTINVANRDKTIQVDWTAATDGGSGLDGYAAVWDTSGTTNPATKNLEETAVTTTSAELADGAAHWFHIRALDNAGNWGTVAHLGPFVIDTAGVPTMKAIVEPQDKPYNTAPTFATFGFDDNNGLRSAWYQIDGFGAGSWVALFTDLANGTKTWSQNGWAVPGFAGLTEGTHTIYFKVIDWGGLDKGTEGELSWRFVKDTVPPVDTGMNLVSASHTLNTPSNDATVDVSWTAATDATSGLDGYSVLWNNTADTTPDATKDIEQTVTTATSNALATGNWWFHIRAVDNAGNWVSTQHIGPFVIDVTAPTASNPQPADGLQDVAANATIQITFNEPMNKALTQAAFSFKQGMTAIRGGFSWSPTGNVLTFTPDAALLYSTTYNVTIGVGAKDIAGNPLATAFTWSFKTKTVVTRIEITPANPSIPLGKTQQFTARGIKSDGTDQSVSGVTWASSLTDVAAINATSGLADTAGKRIGTTVITATATVDSLTVTGNTLLTVGKPVLEAITVVPVDATGAEQPDNPTIALGRAQKFIVKGRYSDNSLAVITGGIAWTSSKTTIATVDASGLATSIAKGDTDIKAETIAATGMLSDTSKLTVGDRQLERLEVVPDNPSVASGRTIQFSAYAYYSDGTSQNRTGDSTWESSTANATVDGSTKGLVHGVTPGTSTITARLGTEATDTTVLTVTGAVLQSVRIDETVLTTPAGQTINLRAYAVMSSGPEVEITANPATIWASLNRGIATVNGTGAVTGVAKGDADITATYMGQRDSVKVDISDPVLTGITISPLNETIPLGTTLQFKATGTYSAGPTRDITSLVAWSSGTTATADFLTPATKGLVTARAEGAAVISAALAPAATATTNLTVGGPALLGIAIDEANPEVPNGEKLQLHATANYTGSVTKDVTGQVTWRSSDTTKAEISGGGEVTGKGVGTATITAEMSGKQGTATLQVKTAILKRIDVTPSSASVPNGRTQQFTATGRFSDGTERDVTAATNVTWAADANAQAQATKGLFKGTAVGTANITASAPGATAGNATLQVTAAVIDTIAISPAQVTVNAGDTTKFTATATMTDGTAGVDVTRTVRWGVSNTAIASITGITPNPDNKLEIDTYTYGQVTVTATGSATATAAVTVNAATLKTITVTPATATIPNGRNQQFRAMGLYTDDSTKDITTQVAWSSSSDTIATIGAATGMAVSKAQGTATMTATLPGKTGTGTLIIIEATLDAVHINPVLPTVVAGDAQDFTATGDYSDGTLGVDITRMVTWTSSNTSVARVNAAGHATTSAAGTATIEASLSGRSDSTLLTVNAPALRTIQVTPAGPSVTFVSGAAPTVQFKATGVYSDGHTEDITGTVTWASVTQGVATIDPAGLATTVAAGTSSITATQPGAPAGVLPGTSTLTIAADEVAPAVRVSNPPDGLTIEDTNLSVTGSVDDVNVTVTILVNGVAGAALTKLNGGIDASGNFSQSATLNVGNNTVVVNAVDGVNNAGSSGTRHVIVDLAGVRPAIVIQRPLDGAVTNNRNVTVSGTATNTTTVTVRINGAPHTATVGTGGTFSLTGTLDEGKNIITAFAYKDGKDGQEPFKGTSGTKTVTLDTIAPVVSVTSPSADSVLGTAGVNITGTVDDPLVTIALLMLNGEAPIVVPVSGGTFTQSASLAPGENSIIIVTTDRVGNTATAGPITVTFDNSKPGVRITSPANRLVTNIAGQTVMGTVDDPTIATATILVNGNPTPITVAPDGTFNTVVALVNGPNTIEVQASDTATPPNTGTSGIVNVTVDPAPPVLTVGLSEPTDSITIIVTSDEALLASPTVTVNPGAATVTMAPVPGRIWSGTYGPLAAGDYVVTIVGTDKAGNTATKTATFTKETITVDGETATTVATSTTTLEVETNGAVTNADITVTQHVESPSGNAGNPAGADVPAAFVEINASTELRNNLRQIYIEVQYDPAELPPDTDESTLRLYIWDITEGDWRLVPDSGVDTVRKVIFGTVDHLSKYGAYGAKKVAPTAPAGGGPAALPGVTDVSTRVDPFGAFIEKVTAASDDAKVLVQVEKGIVAKGAAGQPVAILSVTRMANPPAAPPQDATIVGLTYNLGPEGTTFSKPINVTFTYDPASLPKGAKEDKLVMAYWDAKAGKWVELKGGVVDTVKKTITAPVDHFTVFGVLAYTRPAAFTVSNLAVSPTQVTAGDSAQVTVRVTNTGDLDGTFKVEMKINGTAEATSDVALAGGATKDVSFTLSKTAGTYSIAVGGHTVSFTVRERAVPPPPPKPAAFAASSMSIAPLVVNTGDPITVSVNVANTGELEGTYKVSLKVNGVVEKSSDVTLAGGASQKVSFTVTKDTPGVYTIAIDQLSNSVTVEAVKPPEPPAGEELPQPTTPVWPYIVGIAGGVVVILLVWLGLKRRSKSS